MKTPGADEFPHLSSRGTAEESKTHIRAHTRTRTGGEYSPQQNSEGSDGVLLLLAA